MSEIGDRIRVQIFYPDVIIGKFFLYGGIVYNSEIHTLIQDGGESIQTVSRHELRTDIYCNGIVRTHIYRILNRDIPDESSIYIDLLVYSVGGECRRNGYAGPECIGQITGTEHLRLTRFETCTDRTERNHIIVKIIYAVNPPGKAGDKGVDILTADNTDRQVNFILVNWKRGDGLAFMRPFIIGYMSPVSDRKSTRLNSSHVAISYAVFCSKNKILKHADLRQNQP